MLGDSVRRRIRWLSLRPRTRNAVIAFLAGLSIWLSTLTVDPVTRYLLSFAWLSLMCITMAISLRVVPELHCVSERGLQNFRELRVARSALEGNIRSLRNFINSPPTLGIQKAVVALVPIAITAALRSGVISLDLSGVFGSGSSGSAGGHSGTSIPSGSHGSQFLDLNADGIADITRAGVPVIPIDAYVRSTGLVRAHYRTLPDGILWNNIRT